MKLTEKERDVLEAIRGWDGASIPTECLQNECEINPSSIPGVVSSLVKKGVVECWGTGIDATITITRDEAMTKTARTSNAIDRVLEENGAPSSWTDAEARAVWDSFNEKALFDGFEDFICALIVRAR